jgi:hypothetical protein
MIGTLRLLSCSDSFTHWHNRDFLRERKAYRSLLSWSQGLILIVLCSSLYHGVCMSRHDAFLRSSVENATTQNTLLRISLENVQTRILNVAEVLDIQSAMMLEASAREAMLRSSVRDILSRLDMVADVLDRHSNGIVEASVRDTALRTSIEAALAHIQDIAGLLDAQWNFTAEADSRDAMTRKVMGLRWTEIQQVDRRRWKARLLNIAAWYGAMKACERTPLRGYDVISGPPNWCEEEWVSLLFVRDLSDDADYELCPGWCNMGSLDRSSVIDLGTTRTPWPVCRGTTWFFAESYCS